MRVPVTGFCSLSLSALARRIAVELWAAEGTVGAMTAQPAGSAGVGPHEVIHLGGEAAVVVPVAEYRRLRALEQLASPQEREDAETAAALEEYREWSAAGRPGAISHEQARRLLLGDGR
jgi:hypothetical protein